VDIISPKDAKAAGLKKYFTGKPCKYGHVTERRLYQGSCLECARSKTRIYAAANVEKARIRHRAWRAVNFKKVNALHACRRASKLNATPSWANQEAILAIYAESTRLSQETGILHHVDHVVPLKHPYVCGLHVEFNLRPIPATDNLKKSNRLLSC
jgi:hypothetical protein